MIDLELVATDRYRVKYTESGIKPLLVIFRQCAFDLTVAKVCQFNFNLDCLLEAGILALIVSPEL